MMTVHIRKQGGAAIITIPANILRTLNINVGTELELEVTAQQFVARPIRHTTRQHYTLSELLQGITKETMRTINKKTKWARIGKSVGRELT